MGQPVVSGGDLTAGVARTFTARTNCRLMVVSSLPEAADRIYGVWQPGTDASLTNFDFYLDPGDTTYSPSPYFTYWVSLYSPSNLKENTDFNVRDLN